jgi:glycine/D-amino acid oxidase-like deaminating enzyme/nitrite reductase/ring-hydroxylating ferredoxin subunit
MSKAIPWVTNIDNKPQFHSLDTNLEADVVIVGGGIAGIVTTYLLAKEGKKVVLCEKNKIVSGETGFTTGFITQVFDKGLVENAETWGDEKAKLLWQSGKDIIDLLETIIKEENIECEFKRCPAYIFANNELGFESLKKEVEKAYELGFDNVLLIERNALPFKNHGYMKVENQAKWHVGKFLLSLAKCAEKYGALIYEDSAIHEIAGREKIKVSSRDFTIESEYVIVDTNNPFNSIPEVQERVIPYITYVVNYEVPKGILEEAIYWDTDNPYHYFRIDKGKENDTLMLGGEDHKSGDEPKKDPYKSLNHFLENLYPGIYYKQVETWSGEVLEPIDGIPYIGKTLFNKHMLVSTGFSGNGMTFGPISAVVNRDIVLKRENPWIDLYKLGRLAETGEILKHGIEVAKNVGEKFIHSFKDNDVTEIPNDNGAVIKINNKRIAVYKDKEGNLIKLSPFCTHQKCIVEWNTIEKSWDCPCHGSRFTKDGKVITGPAIEDLSQIVD